MKVLVGERIVALERERGLERRKCGVRRLGLGSLTVGLSDNGSVLWMARRKEAAKDSALAAVEGGDDSPTVVVRSRGDRCIADARKVKSTGPADAVVERPEYDADEFGLFLRLALELGRQNSAREEIAIRIAKALNGDGLDVGQDGAQRKGGGHRDEWN